MSPCSPERNRKRRLHPPESVRRYCIVKRREHIPRGLCVHPPCRRVPRLVLLTCRLTHMGLLIALEGILSVVLDGFCGYSCCRIWGLVLLHRRHSISCHRCERYCVLVRPVVCNIRSSAGPWQSVQSSSGRSRAGPGSAQFRRACSMDRTSCPSRSVVLQRRARQLWAMRSGDVIPSRCNRLRSVLARLLQRLREAGV